MKRYGKILLSSCIVGFMFFSVVAAAAQDSGKWSFFKLKPGEYFKYSMKSERGLTGWVSLKTEDAGGGALNVAIAGDWAGTFSEAVKLKPKKSSGQDFYFSIKDPTASNALGSLVFLDSVFVDNAVWKDGFAWSKGNSTIAVKGGKTVLDVKGLMATYTRKSFGKEQKLTYCVNPAFPLPLYLSVPGANDTFTLELTEKKGI